MRLSALALGVLAVATFAGVAWLALWSGAGLAGLFFDSAPFTKLLDMALIAALVGVLVVGFLEGNGGGSFLRLSTWGLPLLGLLAAAWGGFIIWQAVQATNTTNFMVVAPSVAEALLPLALGLLGGALAAFLNGRKARQGV